MTQEIKELIRTENPARLSRQLRHGRSSYLENRRNIVVTSLTAISAMGLISLYQTGVIGGLPDLPLPYMNSDKVDAAEQAYSRLDMPDAPLGINSYATTLMLAAMGGKHRDREKSWLPLLLLVKTLFDAGQAGKLTADQWLRHRAFCIWCLVAAVATFISVPLAIPEAMSALRHLMRRRL
ncbi:MAG: vitamin K epoxide reductase family protein [Candidatus Promineifilaceae bacterium]|nr:vitamin K epoxide reductase family protein [Candidatus Promineifilaceae bacterium]